MTISIKTERRIMFEAARILHPLMSILLTSTLAAALPQQDETQQTEPQKEAASLVPPQLFDEVLPE